MQLDVLSQEAVLRIGEVSSVYGRTITIKVDKNKNSTDLFFNGEILKNISVNSYIEIKKGFLSIIGKVDGEKIEESKKLKESSLVEKTDKNERFLTVSLVGYINRDGKFIGGTRELPLMGNEAFIITRDKANKIYKLVTDDSLSINIGISDIDEFAIELPIDGLFNSHIAIFGNTGSGKSHTLACMYKELLTRLEEANSELFSQKSNFIIFDFNGEYCSDGCISENKTVFNLSTRKKEPDTLPLPKDSLLDIEILSILSSATEKTQKPFLNRSINFYKVVFNKDEDEALEHFKNILRKQIKHTLQMSDKVRADLLIDYFRQILPVGNESDCIIEIDGDLEWHNTLEGFKKKHTKDVFFSSSEEAIIDTTIFQRVDNFEFEDNQVSKIVDFLYLQLITDVLSNRAQNEHIAPVINKLKSKQKDIDKVFDCSSDKELWESNVIVINLSDVNLDMKKTIPLLLAKKVYGEHKQKNNKASLNIIIDEAHNILSRESFREAESWKDYRLETFEEIIKEGRKFGVFVTIASQRPNDISPTITSQAHNYFIHRLVNQKDLLTISNAVSYIDKTTEESIPSLPIGTCIFSGIATQVPLKIRIKELGNEFKPKSQTIEFKKLLSETSD